MTESTINLTFNNDFLNQIDLIAKNEFRTRNELIYNSIKLYIDQKQKLQKLYAYGENIAAKNNFSENDIIEEIKNYRKTNENSH